MKIISILVASAAAAAIGFADAKFTRGSLYKTKEHADRHLDSTELSMPGQPGDNSGITELLADDGVSKEIVSGFLTALEISGAKMSSGPARDLCATILDEILDFFLFRREVEEAIKVIVCGPITSLKPSQAPSDVPSAKPSDVPSAIASLKPSQAPSDVPSAKPSDVPSAIASLKPSQSPSDVPTVTGQCQKDSDCGLGEYCGSANPNRTCANCRCYTSGGAYENSCSSDNNCSPFRLCAKNSYYVACPNMNN